MKRENGDEMNVLIMAAYRVIRDIQRLALFNQCKGGFNEGLGFHDEHEV